MAVCQVRGTLAISPSCFITHSRALARERWKFDSFARIELLFDFSPSAEQVLQRRIRGYTDRMDTDVIVVGLGAAGLAAALRLAERGVRMIAVDGRERIGGRVRWERAGTVAVPAELGAEFIHGDAPETSAFFAGAGLTSVPTGDESWAYAAGFLQRDDDDFDPGDLFAGAHETPRDESVAAYLRRFDDRPEMRDRVERARQFVEGFEAADPGLASARAIADELASGVDSISHRPVGSYAPLIAAVTEQCRNAGAGLRLGVTVEQIRWERGAVTVTGRDETGAVVTLRARCAVVTVPAGVLQQSPDAVPFGFDPPLPAEKRTAIDGVAMGQVVRVVLAFRTPFWETIAGGRFRDAAFFRCADGAFTAFWTQLPLRDRTIVAWAGGPRATALDGLTDDERIEHAREEFGRMIGEPDRARAEFEAGVMHDWARDPFACGAYSYVVTGAATARADLGRPVESTLFFAGEATATDGQAGTVSGAFGSGFRAAGEVLDALGTRIAPAGKET